MVVGIKLNGNSFRDLYVGTKAPAGLESNWLGGYDFAPAYLRHKGAKAVLKRPISGFRPSHRQLGNRQLGSYHSIIDG